MLTKTKEQRSSQHVLPYQKACKPKTCYCYMWSLAKSKKKGLLIYFGWLILGWHLVNFPSFGNTRKAINQASKFSILHS